MQYELEIGGRLRQVTVVRTGDAFAVSLDGHERQVDVARIDEHTLSLVVDGVWLQDVTVCPDPATGGLMALVGATPVAVTLNDRRRSPCGEDSGASGSGPQRLLAPMPGKVVRILVKPGDAVRARQPVVVVEAMKMENELRVGRDGTVAEIHVHEGSSVDAGALLIVIQ